MGTVKEELMNKKTNNGSFWPSYVDIMTTLFAIMLVLFVVSYSRFKNREELLESLVEQYENIITVYSTVGSIDSTDYFNYFQENKKHLFTVDVEYQRRAYKVNELKLDTIDKREADNKRDSIIAAGKIIKNTILQLEKSEVFKSNGNIEDNIKFLVVIEGQSSKVKFDNNDWENNYTLSYLRAQFLNDFWKANDIDLASLPKCELIISGSGEGGVPRYVPDDYELKRTSKSDKEYKEKWNKIEERNQRFLIHIVPVIGNIELKKNEIDAYKKRKGR